MSPRRKGDTSEERNIWLFKFELDGRTEIDIVKDSLIQHGFRNFKLNLEMYDIIGTVSLELEFNASKFAKDLIKRYKWIKEIEVAKK